MRTCLLISVLSLFCSKVAANDPLTSLTNVFCVDCHGQKDPESDLRLDHVGPSFFESAERIETLIAVLTERQMPPPKRKQPPDELRHVVVAYLKGKLAELEAPRAAILKRLTREEYTNTINDLFHANLDLSELLPPAPPGDGFNKWAESQRMSPHQVESYLKTARFIADSLILDQRPVQQTWEFGPKHFNGSGRGDFNTGKAFVLSTHYPWRSNLHFFGTEQRKRIFCIPEFGRYRMEADVTVRHSSRIQTISVSTGDPRYPTNFKKVARMVVPPEGDTVAVELTLTAGTHVSYTYESADTWNVGQHPEEYDGPQVAFSKVRITGPITATWPTTAEQRIFADGRFRSLRGDNLRPFVEHVARLLLNRSLPEKDIIDFEQLTANRLNSATVPKAAARTLLTALLSSPHFIYKHEPRPLDDVALAYRLSYFLWNSVPDEQLIALARSGKLGSEGALTEQVERMLDHPYSERFYSDFTRQWLQTDKIDDIGPDDRVHDKKRVTFMRIRELAKEPQAFFEEVMQYNLSMINFIDSDFAMVNDETAAFYGYEGVAGRSFQRVAIPDDSERGGLIGQAGLLKLTSNKFATSPILRGTWLLKNIYGQQLNPPPNAVFDEPDLRGAETTKEVIEQHKSTETCNRCHARIDPLGMALEHYDEMGLWRDEYRHVEVTSLENNDDSVRQRAAAIDSTGTLPDGRRVSSMADLKAVLMEDREQIIKGILSKLASYALACEIGMRDEALIDDLYHSIAEEDYSLRAAIHAIVKHESFRH